MKSVYFLLSIISLIFVSCSSTYNVTDFKSKDEFYKDVNKNINGRIVNVTLTNHSTFTTDENGAQVNGDFLSLTQYRVVQDTTIPRSQIEKIDYSTNFGNPSARFRLKNGTTITAENVRMSKEDVEFNTRLPYLFNIPIKKVTQVSYNKRWIGLIEGIPLGFLTSFIVAAEGESGTKSDTGFFGSGFAGVIGVPMGTIMGGILGWLIGHNYSYQFTQ
jgi:hypothetical protein